MIIQTGLRTDIPAFYAEWFLNRLEAGFVCVRNPYHLRAVTRYRLSPDVVDAIGFCTKNPAPLLPYLGRLSPYGQFWYVTITPYGPDIEPHVPDKMQVMRDFRRLSEAVGSRAVGWRYDPFFCPGHILPNATCEILRTWLRTWPAVRSGASSVLSTCIKRFGATFPRRARCRRGSACFWGGKWPVLRRHTA